MPKFIHKPTVIEATRLGVEVQITSSRVTGGADPGDWLLTDINGEQYAISHDSFMKLYEPADDDAAEYLDRVRR